jgi:hypothetical protein
MVHSFRAAARAASKASLLSLACPRAASRRRAVFADSLSARSSSRCAAATAARASSTSRSALLASRLARAASNWSRRIACSASRTAFVAASRAALASAASACAAFRSSAFDGVACFDDPAGLADGAIGCTFRPLVLLSGGSPRGRATGGATLAPAIDKPASISNPPGCSVRVSRPGGSSPGNARSVVMIA